MTEPTPEFLALARDAGIEFDRGDLDRLALYLARLLDENTRQNLTAIDDPSQAWVRHIFDALTLLAPLADLPDDAHIIDVGSGCGVPGIPLAIVLPRVRFTLLEATGKKAAFLERVAASLGLDNVRVVRARAEAAGHDRGQRLPSGERAGGHREAYHAVLARAVGPLNVVAELTVPLARPDGLILLVKGRRADEELAEGAEALRLLRASHSGTIDTPTGRIVVLVKDAPTPSIYPRRDGEPKRAPLGARPASGARRAHEEPS